MTREKKNRLFTFDCTYKWHSVAHADKVGIIGENFYYAMNWLWINSYEEEETFTLGTLSAKCTRLPACIGRYKFIRCYDYESKLYAQLQLGQAN